MHGPSRARLLVWCWTEAQRLLNSGRGGGRTRSSQAQRRGGRRAVAAARSSAAGVPTAQVSVAAARIGPVRIGRMLLPHPHVTTARFDCSRPLALHASGRRSGAGRGRACCAVALAAPGGRAPPGKDRTRARQSGCGGPGGHAPGALCQRARRPAAAAAQLRLGDGQRRQGRRGRGRGGVGGGGAAERKKTRRGGLKETRLTKRPRRRRRWIDREGNGLSLLLSLRPPPAWSATFTSTGESHRDSGTASRW